MMKAAVINSFGDTDVFEIEKDMPRPVPADDQLLIQVKASSVNPIDWKQRKGNHKLIMGSKFPIILGYDVSGVVVETGKDIKNFNPGDEVFGVLDNKYGGALAEYAVGHEKCFSLKPQMLDYPEAAAIPLVSLTVLQALRDKVALQKGDKILINGASGGVGHVAVQIAKIMGAEVTAVASYRNRDFVYSLEPDHFIDYTEKNILKLEERYDVFFDVAGVYSFPKCLRLLKPGGIYINTLPRPKMLLHKILQLFTRRKKVKTLLMKHSRTDLQKITKWINDQRLKIEVDEIFKLENIAAVHDYAQEGHSRGKNVILISQ